MRWTEERAPSRGNDLDEDAGQERRRGEGRVGEGEQGGGLLENLVRGQTLKATEGHKVYLLEGKGRQRWGGHSGDSGPIPHT